MTEIETKMFQKLQSEHLDFELTRVKFRNGLIGLEQYEFARERFYGVKSAARIVLDSDRIAEATNAELTLTGI